MRFGRVATADAVGAVSAHTVRAGEVVLKKGAVVDPGAAAELEVAGVKSLVVARLEPGDVGEDEAAGRLARALAGPNVRVEAPFTGRSNLFAQAPGVLLVDEGVARVNAVDEAITAATLVRDKAVVAGEMVATVKIIPYAVAGAALDQALAAAPAGGVRVAPYRLRRVAAISTLLPGLKESVIAKTVATLARRLAPAGAAVATEARVAHDEAALAPALARLAREADLVVVFGASAIADRRDVIPRAIEAAGGQVAHLGMPVDPGNLLLVGAVGAVPVIGAPGCARSPKENGFDWALRRLLAGLPVTRAEIVGLGIGGLLMEIVSRPQPRTGEPSRQDDDADD